MKMYELYDSQNRIIISHHLYAKFVSDVINIRISLVDIRGRDHDGPCNFEYPIKYMGRVSV